MMSDAVFEQYLASAKYVPQIQDAAKALANTHTSSAGSSSNMPASTSK